MYIDVMDLRVADDGTVIVFFTDKTRFEYHTGTRLWREINPDIELGAGGSGNNAQQTTSNANSTAFAVATSTGQKITSSGLQLSADELNGPQTITSQDSATASLVDLINKLDFSAKRQIQKLNSTAKGSSAVD